MSIIPADVVVRNKVSYLSNENNSFEAIYTEVRKAENRIYDKESLQMLPYIQGDKEKEWKMRANTLENFKPYISKKGPQNILEIGCGNGWFAHRLSEIETTEIYAVDLNQLELEQAANIFESHRLRFIYADIFDPSAEVFKHNFDIIYLAASIQYFPDITKLLNRLKSFLRDNGEIHILDSPFYKQNKQKEAQVRSSKYYSKLGFEEMAEHYFHQSWESLQSFKPRFLYRPSIYQRIFKNRRNPFPWVMIKN